MLLAICAAKVPVKYGINKLERSIRFRNKEEASMSTFLKYAGKAAKAIVTVGVILGAAFLMASLIPEDAAQKACEYDAKRCYNGENVPRG